MRRAFAFFVVIIIILVIGIISYQKFYKKWEKNPAKEKNMTREIQLNGKKIAVVVAYRDFRDEEYFIPFNILKNAGADVVTVSTSKGTAVGADGGEAKIDMLIDDIDVKDFDAIVFVGGPGCLKYLDNEKSYKLIRESVSNNMLLASICISPVILAKAGVLEGKKATVWSNMMDKSGVKILKDYGALYYNQPVVVDGKIITANGPGAAKEFAQTIINLLTSQ